MKPVINIDDVPFDDVETNGIYTSSRALLGTRIGASKLGYNLTVLPPGKVQCPFHAHRAEEEMFFILDGEGELRFGDRRYPIRKHDIITCSTGGAEVAHQIINTGTVPMRYLALSNRAEIDVCEYPDSGKSSVGCEAAGQPEFRAMHLAEARVDYYEREPVTIAASHPAARSVARKIKRPASSSNALDVCEKAFTRRAFSRDTLLAAETGAPYIGPERRG